MDEKLRIALLFLIVFVAANVFIRDMSSLTKGTTGSSAKPSAKSQRSCGTVTLSCTAEAEVEEQSCDEESALRKLQARLVNPLLVSGCHGADDRLAKSCFEPCRLDFGSIIVVSGEAKIDEMSAPDDKGTCQVRGRKPATLSGECIKKVSDKN